MAQSQPAAPSAGSFFLAQRLIVQFGITEESPEGGVVAMEPGWYTPDNTDPRVLANPVIRAMQPQTSQAAARNQAQAELMRKMANGEATGADLQKLNMEQAAEETKEREAATEEWTARAQDAADKNAPFVEPHPDPAVNYARWITSSVPQYIATGGMQSKIEPPVNAPPITPTSVRPTVTPPAQRAPAPEAH